MTQRVIQIVDLPTLQEHETIVDFTADSPLVSLLPELCTTTHATSITPQSQTSMSAIVEYTWSTSYSILASIISTNNEQFFAPRQAYVALSRASCLDDITIHALDRGVITEYSRLRQRLNKSRLVTVISSTINKYLFLVNIFIPQALAVLL